jgi:hypothetical protein
VCNAPPDVLTTKKRVRTAKTIATTYTPQITLKMSMAPPHYHATDMKHNPTPKQHASKSIIEIGIKQC